MTIILSLAYSLALKYKFTKSYAKIYLVKKSNRNKHVLLLTFSGFEEAYLWKIIIFFLSKQETLVDGLKLNVRIELKHWNSTENNVKLNNLDYIQVQSYFLLIYLILNPL